MWATAITFLKGNWMKLAGGFMMIMTVVSLLYVAISNYNESIRDSERLRNQNAQLEQVIEDNKQFRIRMDKLDKKSDQILIDVGKKNNKVAETHTEVTRYIQSPEAQASNRESSDVLKTTVRMLRDED